MVESVKWMLKEKQNMICAAKMLEIGFCILSLDIKLPRTGERNGFWF